MECLARGLLEKYCEHTERILTVVDVGAMGGVGPLWRNLADYTW